MAWVRGIREVRHVTVAVDDEQVGLRRGPVVTKVERVITELPASAIARIICARRVVLPAYTGAGPCGTLARRTSGRSWAAWWSFHRLVEPIRAYYATYEPPMRFGAKPGPRGRRAA
jgi:hypothetical protein